MQHIIARMLITSLNYVAVLVVDLLFLQQIKVMEFGL